jgi:hypothetical protein
MLKGLTLLSQRSRSHLWGLDNNNQKKFYLVSVKK